MIGHCLHNVGRNCNKNLVGKNEPEQDKDETLTAPHVLV